jgi:hypothetical protein
VVNIGMTHHRHPDIHRLKEGKMKRVIVEVVVPAHLSASAALDNIAKRLPGLVVDRAYEPVPAPTPPQPGLATGPSQQAVVIRGEIEDSLEEQLKASPGVIGVWSDARVEPFDAGMNALQ